MSSPEDEATKQGNLLRDKGDFDGAIAAYTEAIRLNPENAQPYSGRGQAYLRKGEFDKAIADYTEAIRLEPQSARAFGGRGWCYEQKGDNRKAVADFAQAKKLEYKANPARPDCSRRPSKLPALVTLVAVGLLMVYCDTQHLCHLQSIAIEVPLLIGVVLACYLWTARAKTSGQAWLCTGLALVLALAIEIAYLTWLHSDFFPRALLSPKAKQRQAELDKLRQDNLRQQFPGG